MSKENKPADKSSAASSSEPAGMNTGVAIIGFILCFIAGAMPHVGLRPEAHPQWRASPRTRASAGAEWSRQRLADPGLEQRPDVGQARRTGHHRPLLGFPVPVLLARRRDDGSGEDDVRPDKVRIIWKNEPLPFHPNAKPAAEAAQGVFALKGNDAFWKFHDTAFKNQKALGEDELREVGASRPASPTSRSSRPVSRRTRGRRRSTEDHANAQEDRRERHAGVLHQRRRALGRAAVRQVQGRHRPGAAEGRRRRSRPARPKDKVYVAMSAENKKNAPAPRRGRREGRHEDACSRSPSGRRPVGQPERARHHRRVLGLPVPVLQAGRADAQGKSTTPTATRCVSCGRTSPSRSTRARSPQPKSRSKREPRRATTASGTRTTRSSTRSRSSTTRISRTSRSSLASTWTRSATR